MSGTIQDSSTHKSFSLEKIDRNYSFIQNDNSELRAIVDSLSRQLRNLEKRVEIQT